MFPEALLTQPLLQLFNMLQMPLQKHSFGYDLLIWETYFVCVLKLGISKFSQRQWDDLLRIVQANNQSKFFQHNKNEGSTDVQVGAISIFVLEVLF